MGKRNYQLDNCKFILIVLVVVGHIVESTSFQSDVFLKSVVTIIYSFHMPLFAFIAGHFSKPTLSLDYTKKIMISLIIPYVVFQTICLIYFSYLGGSNPVYFTYLTPFSLLWFLFSLVIWKLALPYVRKVPFVLPVLIIIGILAGYIEGIGQPIVSPNGLVYVGSIYSASRLLVFFPFFVAGHFFTMDQLLIFRTNRMKIITGILFAVVVGIIAINYDKIDYTWFFGRNSYQQLNHHEWYAGVYRLFTYAVSIAMCFFILVLVPHGSIPFITKMGQRTMYPYLLHIFIVRYLAVKYNYFEQLHLIHATLPILFGVLLTIVLSSGIIQRIFRVLIEPTYLFKRKDDHSLINRPNKL